jgi:hypothetical protein
MAFSFLVELLNMWIRKREKARKPAKPIELREPHLQPVHKDTFPTPYDDSAH